MPYEHIYKVKAFLRTMKNCAVSRNQRPTDSPKVVRNNNYGIFALEIKAEYSVLQSLSKLPGVRSVDVIQSEAAIAMASQVEKPISYICIPEKPDGTA